MRILECIVSAILWGIAGAVVGVPCFAACLLVISVVLSIILSIITWSNGFAIVDHYGDLILESLGVRTLVGLMAFPGMVVGIILGAMGPIWEEEDRRRAAEAEEAARLQRHREEQQRYRKQMIVLGEQSIGLFESLPKYLSSAEKWLEQAEVDFADGAFAPFWDSIENAAKMLGRFDEGVRHIKDNSSSYAELVRKYEGTPPQFPLRVSSVEKLGVGIATAKHMQAIVRKAQRNFQFAMIYEQRKTNQILVAGFKNLAQALEQMTRQITASIDDLAGSVDVLTSTLNESMQAIHSRLGDIAEMTSQYHDEQAAREEKVLEMLDNIQRGRRPP